MTPYQRLQDAIACPLAKPVPMSFSDRVRWIARWRKCGTRAAKEMARRWV